MSGVGGVGPRPPLRPASGAASGAAPVAGAGEGAAAGTATLRSPLLAGQPFLAKVLCGEMDDLRFGDKGDGVAAVQQALGQLGHLRLSPLGADGRFGRDTEKALLAFQRKEGLTPSGRLDKGTLLALDGRLTGARPTRGPVTALTSARPAPEPLGRTPSSYLKNRTEREAYDFVERKLWTGASLGRGIDLAVTDADTLAVLDRLETLAPASYNHVLHALAATKVEGEPLAPSVLDKLIVRGTSQFGNAALSSRFGDQLLRKLEGQEDARILRHISPDSVDRLKGWASFQKLVDLFA